MSIVGIGKQGTARIKTQNGTKVVGVINIRTSERESAPQDNFFWYDLSHEHLLMKSLKRLHPVNIGQPPAQPQAESNQEPAADA